MGALGDHDLRRRDAALDAPALAGGEDGALDRLRAAARQEAGGGVGAVQQPRGPADDLRLDPPERREGHRVQGVLVQEQARGLLGDVVDRRPAVVDEAERSAVRPPHVVAALLPQVGDDLVDRPASARQLHRRIIALASALTWTEIGDRVLAAGAGRGTIAATMARATIAAPVDDAEQDGERRLGRHADGRAERPPAPSSGDDTERDADRGCAHGDHRGAPAHAAAQLPVVNPRARSVASCGRARRIATRQGVDHRADRQHPDGGGERPRAGRRCAAG